MKQKNEKQVELYPVCSHSSGYEKIFPGVLSEISLLLGKEEGNNHCAVISKDQSCDLLLDFLQFRTGATTIDLRGGKDRATDADVMKKTSTPCKDSSDTKEIKAQSSWDTVLRVTEIEN